VPYIVLLFQALQEWKKNVSHIVVKYAAGIDFNGISTTVTHL
jgi:hypothetical protein